MFFLSSGTIFHGKKHFWGINIDNWSGANYKVNYVSTYVIISTKWNDNMDFYTKVGKVALGSRLRRLNDWIGEDASKIYDLYEVEIDPKWFPVFYTLSIQKEATVTGIANFIGQSHPSVSQVIKEMKNKGFLETAKNNQDKRIKNIRLSEKGRQYISKLEQQCEDVAHAVEEILSSTHHNLWKAIEEFEFLLSEKNLYERIKNIRREKCKQHIELLDYTPDLQPFFKKINQRWIEDYFTMEDTDYKYLDDPNKTILEQGGYIIMARYKGKIVGTCALIKLDENTYELAKMAVLDEAQGIGIGSILGETLIQKARELGAKSVYVESNTVLSAAIRLYSKLGFRKTAGKKSPYERCNIQMQLDLE